MIVNKWKKKDFRGNILFIKKKKNWKGSKIARDRRVHHWTP
jgi:hypothetical protein